MVDINSNNIDSDDVDAVLGQPAPKADYDIARNNFLFATEQITGNSNMFSNTWVYQKNGPTDTVANTDIGVLNTSRGARNPLATIRQYGTDNYLLTAGNGPIVSAELDAGAFFEITNTNQLSDRARLTSYWTGNNDRLVPVGISTSRTTGYHFINASSTVGADQFENYIVSKFWGDIDNIGVTSDSEFLDIDLNTLLHDAGVLPSLIDRYDYNGLLRTNVFKGSVADGYLISSHPTTAPTAEAPYSPAAHH